MLGERLPHKKKKIGSKTVAMATSQVVFFQGLLLMPSFIYIIQYFWRYFILGNPGAASRDDWIVTGERFWRYF